MDVRKAILQAAEHIEKNPKDYSFCTVDIPADCGTPGCLLGWIGHFAGMTGYINAVPPILRQLSERHFYSEMIRLVPSKEGKDWHRDAATAVKGLRAFADKHFPRRTDAELVSDLKARILSEPYSPTIIDTDLVKAI